MIVIREAEERDLPRVVKINRAELPENYPFGFFEHVWRHWKRYFLVAELSGEVVGYLMSIIEHRHSLLIPDEGLRRRIEEGERGSHLISLAVLSPFKRQGIASALMTEYLRRLKEDGVKFSFLEVRVSNEPAISLYKKFGYKVVKVLPAYYMDGEDAYLMVKEL